MSLSTATPAGSAPAGPIRVLVIGAGPAAAQMHLPVLARLRDRGEVVLVRVCDLQRERTAAARRQFRFLEECGDGLAAVERSDVDAVYIFGSAQLHYEYGLAALYAGKHLFVEKPIAPSYVQARELAQVARARGLTAVGGHNRRFYQSLVELRARAGKAGWRYAEAVFHKAEFGKTPLFGARTWLGANGIHALDALVFMMGGLPEQLTAVAAAGGTAEPSAFSAVMRWRDGGQGVFLCNNDAGARREEYVFHSPGETCTVTADALVIEKDATLVRAPSSSAGRFPAGDAAMSLLMSGSISAEHEAFIQGLRGRLEPPHSIDALAPSLFLAELIENGFSGRVQLPQVEAAPSPREVAGTSILVTQPAELQPALARLLPHYRLVSVEDVRASVGPRPEVVAAIVGRGSPPLPPDVLDKLPGLAVVGFVALSLARHAPETLLARDIALVNASAAYADSVAEFALGLAVLGRRRAFASHEMLRRGGWGAVAAAPGIKGALRRLARSVRPAIKAAGLEPLFLRFWRTAGPWVEAPAAGALRVHDLRGATAGLVGWGANARAFTERLLQAGVRVLVYSEHASPADIRKAGAVPASLHEVLAADIVSLHRGLNKDTRHCLGAPELEKLRSGALLINVARGALIEPGALLARLKRGDIFACLDTYEEEPLAASHPLRTLPNVFLTSHIAGGSPDMHAAAAREVAGKVAAYLAGRAVEPVSAERLRTMT